MYAQQNSIVIMIDWQKEGQGRAGTDRHGRAGYQETAGRVISAETGIGRGRDY